MHRNRKKIPQLAKWLTSKFIDKALLEEFYGDLDEMYEERISSRGKAYAKLMYWIDVLHLIGGFGSFSILRMSNNPALMWKHHVIVSFRNLARSKTYSFINILSLSIGMGACLTICQYVYFELSYDKFNHNFENIYRIVIDRSNPEGDSYPYPYETGYEVGVAAKANIPEVENYVRLHKYSGGAVVTNPEQNKIFREDALDMFFVDKKFLHVFDFTVKQGKKETAFNDKFSVVITEDAAQKYFGSEDPVGKLLTLSGGVSPGNYTVTAILKTLPINSQFQFNFLLPIENYMEYGWGGAATKNDDGWSNPDMTTYVTLKEPADFKTVGRKLDELVNNHNSERNAHKGIKEIASLQPLIDIHLKSDPNVDQSLVRNNGNIQDINFFSIIALFILAIAWINYINLSTASSIHRAKEVGIRKSIGAFKSQLVFQFMTESAVTNGIAGVFAIGVASISLPIVSKITDIKLELSLIQIPTFWMWFSIMIFLGSFLSGLFPALILSSFKPVSVLTAFKIPKTGRLSLRSGLITFQFLVSLFLISGTYLIYKQITFMKSQKLGMDMEKILVLKGPEVNLDESNLETTLETFRKKIADYHSISAVAASSSVPGKGYNTGLGIRKLGEPASAEKFGRVVFAGFGLPDTYDLEFLAGKSPTQDNANSAVVPIVINEEAVRVFGLGLPKDAIQEKLLYKGDTFSISGVVKNFHWHSLADAHTPYLFEFYADCRSYFSISMNLSDIPESLAHIETVYNSFFPGNAFDYFFLENEFNRQYQADVQFGKLFFIFAVLAIVIACIGLFALVSYSSTLRTKEIGVRKILGASMSNLVMLLSKEYLILLFIANVLAVPAILIWGKTWLEHYAFRADLGMEVFLIPGLCLIFISFLTVSYRTFITAKANPVESLRSE